MAYNAVAWVDFVIQKLSYSGDYYEEQVGKTHHNYIVSAHTASCNVRCQSVMNWGHCDGFNSDLTECDGEHPDHGIDQSLSALSRWSYDSEQLQPKKTDKELKWLTGKTSVLPSQRSSSLL